jgi:tetrahydromethanopterin S-methyltransferase subunit G
MDPIDFKKESNAINKRIDKIDGKIDEKYIYSY